jgi:hypothetical protein
MIRNLENYILSDAGTPKWFSWQHNYVHSCKIEEFSYKSENTKYFLNKTKETEYSQLWSLSDILYRYNSMVSNAISSFSKTIKIACMQVQMTCLKLTSACIVLQMTSETILLLLVLSPVSWIFKPKFLRQQEINLKWIFAVACFESGVN